MRYIRSLAVVFVSITILFFIAGYFVAEFDVFQKFDNNTYLKYATILGGSASILGLLALILPSITTADLKRLESQSLKEVAELAEQMQKAEEQISKRNEQNLSLKDQNKNLELQIKKASLILSLETKLKRNYQDLIEIFYESEKNKKQLEALNQEIKESENSKQLEEIISLIKEREKNEIDLDSALWPKPSFMGIGVDINALARILKNKVSK